MMLHCPKNNLNPRPETVMRSWSGCNSKCPVICLHLSGPETRQIALHLLKPLQCFLRIFQLFLGQCRLSLLNSY